MVREIKIDMTPGAPIVTVDGKVVATNLRATFKRDGSLSTLKLSTNDKRG